jgi:hypothetical protein
MLAFLLPLIPAFIGPILNYFTAVKNSQVQLFQAKTGAAEEVAVAALQAQAQVQSKWWFAALPPALIGATIAGYVAKSILWDKVIGSFVGCSGHTAPGTCMVFNTDPLAPELNWVFMAVIASYFGTAVVDKFLTAK